MPSTSPVPAAIYAKDSSAKAESDAFARQAASVRWGRLGPIDPLPMVIIPMAPGANLPRTAAQRAADIFEETPTTGGLAWIRRHPYAIAGYASVFNVTSGGDRVAPGAFRGSIAAKAVCLLVNHPEAGATASLASMRARTLHLEEDRFGLWFEAALPDDVEGRRIHALIGRGGLTGVSYGAYGGHVDVVAGVRTLSELGAWEISLLTAPHRPRFAQTWAAHNSDAHRRRRYQG